MQVLRYLWVRFQEVCVWRQCCRGNARRWLLGEPGSYSLARHVVIGRVYVQHRRLVPGPHLLVIRRPSLIRDIITRDTPPQNKSTHYDVVTNVVSEARWRWDKTFFSETRGYRCKKMWRHLFSASPLRACHLTRAVGIWILGNKNSWKLRPLPWNLEAIASGAGAVSMLTYFLIQI